MSQFSVGVYKTKAGMKAIIAQVRQAGKIWVLVGAIEEPVTKTLIWARWRLSGEYSGSKPCPGLDLAERIGD